VAVLLLASSIAGCTGFESSPSPGRASADSTLAGAIESGLVRPVCRHDVAPGTARCLSYILTDTSRAPRAGGHPAIAGYGPADLQSAYNLGAAIGNPGGTVALVFWYNDPNLDADLAAYRSQFGLPACTEASGCLKQVNQLGGSSLPMNDANAAVEESLDVDMVSANCPNCKIIFVEATQPTLADLRIAENTAATLAGVVAVSNSWEAGSEIATPSFKNAFNHPGRAIVASAGDSGYSVSSPSDYGTVTAALGTTLTAGGGSRGWTERVWNGTGSGCSAIIAPPAWQVGIEITDGLLGCSKRVVGDVAYVADPGTGVAMYDTFGQSGWLVVGGTSVGAPAEAALYALSGSTAGTPAGLAYSNVASFYDITLGTNGTCTPHWLCRAFPGYDAPSGVGSPNGIGGF
jgi:subtilase family serine protease